MHNHSEKSLLHVAPPSKCNTQQTTQKGASSYATSAQHTPTKPLSLLELARNRLCNNHATSTQKGMQQPPEKSLLHVAFTSERNKQQTHEELTRLVRLCGTHYGFTELEHSDALAIALADPVNALTCFRGMAARLSLAI